MQAKSVKKYDCHHDGFLRPAALLARTNGFQLHLPVDLPPPTPPGQLFSGT
jgi:hypothetical protein